jgi:glutathione synthase/RimK-type ligase-like ATP-grasp enzyme
LTTSPRSPRPARARRRLEAATTVLVACPPGDTHSMAVAIHLADMGLRPVPLFLSRLPETGLAAGLGGGRGARCLLATEGGSFDPAEVRAIWWRRPEPVEGWPIAGASRTLGAAEWTAALAGVVRVAGGFWVNDPASEEVARRKLVQLEMARRAGLPVPRTLVTNDAGRARAFIRACRRGAIAKSLASSVEGGYTRRVSERDPWLADRLRAGPAILQERVDGLDLRVTLVGREVFAMSMDARAGDPDDVRLEWDKVAATARPARLPAELSRRLLALLGALGLRYGAVDLRRRPGGGYAFLEVNPGGQWMHAEAATGHPIGRTLARLLASGGTPAGRRPRPTGRPSPSLP